MFITFEYIFIATFAIIKIVIIKTAIDINTSVVFAYIDTDYDFTDELEEDRVGIGFTWNTEDRILNITGIKNNNLNLFFFIMHAPLRALSN